MDDGPDGALRRAAVHEPPPAAEPQAREVALPPLPPARERGDHAGYLVGALGSFGLVAVMIVGAHGRQLVVALAAAVLSIGGAGLAAVIGARRTRSRADRRRRRWLELAHARVAAVEAAAASQRAALDARHPRDVATLLSRARGGPGFCPSVPAPGPLTVGVGLGSRAALVTLSADVLEAGLDTPDVECLRFAGDAVAAAVVVHDCVRTVDLSAGGLAIVGPIAAGRELARWIVAEAATARPADQLAIGVATADLRDDGAWGWLRWLPHAHDPAVPDGTATSVAPTLRELDALLGPAAGDQLVVIDHAVPQEDMGTLSAAGRSRRGYVVLATEHEDLVATVAHRIDLRDDMLRTSPGDVIPLDTVAALSQEEARDVARALAPLRAAGSGLCQAPAGPGRLLGHAQVAADPARAWAERREADLLRTPLGTDDQGMPKWLDLRESAVGGMGPHGLVVGATGTGKSEVLRTLVTGLVARHSPADLALLLVDFKGGAAFDPFSGLPHVAGLITNLAEDDALVERVCQALEGEMADRQEALRSAGVDSLRQLRATGGACPPSLLVVVDEFSELLTVRPDALDVLLRLGRLGRSLGIHLVLAAQRWEEGRLRGLEAHLRWRLCLRTFTAAESMAVLGTPAATTLPTQPGAAWLAVDGVMTRIQVAHSGVAAAPPVLLSRAVRPLRLRPPSTPQQSTGPTEAVTSVRDGIVRAIRAIDAPAVGRIWLPPLGPDVAALPAGAVGLVDRPRLRRQEPLVLDSLASGPVAVVGAPGSGVSGLLGVLATTCSRPDLGIAVLECGGSGLAAVATDPAVFAWAGSADPDHMVAVLDAVEAAAAGTAGSRLPGTVLLVVDGLARARDVVEDLDVRLARVASAAGDGTVGLIVGAQRWGDLRGGLRDLVPTRLELRLADPADSQHGRAAAAALRGAPPGRGLTPAGEQVQFARATPRAALRPAGVRRRLEPLPVAVGERRDGFAVRAGDLAAVPWAPSDGHLIVLGDRGAGRSTALRQIVRARSRGRTIVLDPRRSLEDIAAERDTRWIAAEEAASVLAAVAAGCAAGDHDDLLVVVDDADLLPAAASAALGALAPHLRRAEDLGVGLVLARPVTGWLRASYDPVLQALRDSAPTTLLLAGDPTEGPVVAALRARRDPPGRGRLVGRRGEITHVQVVAAEARAQVVTASAAGGGLPPRWRSGAA